MTLQRTATDPISAATSNSLHGYWPLCLAQGGFLIALGLAAMLLPELATYTDEVLVGVLLLLAGGLGLCALWWKRRAPVLWNSLFSALLAVVTGVGLVASPRVGLRPLTAVLGVYFLLEGGASILAAIEHGHHGVVRWRWLATTGAIDVALAVAALAGLPRLAPWSIGVLVGISLLAGGSALIGMSIRARRGSVAAAAAPGARPAERARA